MVAAKEKLSFRGTDKRQNSNMNIFQFRRMDDNRKGCLLGRQAVRWPLGRVTRVMLQNSKPVAIDCGTAVQYNNSFVLWKRLYILLDGRMRTHKTQSLESLFSTSLVQHMDCWCLFA